MWGIFPLLYRASVDFVPVSVCTLNGGVGLSIEPFGLKTRSHGKYQIPKITEEYNLPAILNYFYHNKFPFGMSQMCIESTVRVQKKWEQMSSETWHEWL